MMIAAVRHRPSYLVLAACCAAVSSCGGAGYPLEHYEAVYSKAALRTPAPDPAFLERQSPQQQVRIAHGRYLVQITGCAACHTEQALVGEPDPQRELAGSHLGIAYTNPMREGFPGVAYPANLTPDPATGLGNWTDAQIAAAIRAGSLNGEPGHLVVMSWPLYQHMTDDDVAAVVAYLRSIPAIANAIPPRVPPGTRASTSYVYFGVFRSGPAITR